MIDSNCIVHPSSSIEGNVELSKTASIGPNCYLNGRILIGHNATLVSGVMLTGHVVVERNASIDSCVCIASNAERVHTNEDKTIVSEGSYVGAGSVLYRGVIIGRYAHVAPGSIISRNVPAYAIVSGNPAVITGYTALPSQNSPISCTPFERRDAPGIYPLNVNGVLLYQFQQIRDLRGDLTVGEFERSVPFKPKRYFIVFDVPSYETRGEHAHKNCDQFLICPSGSVSIVVDDGKIREEVTLSKPTMGLFIPRGVWGVQYKYILGATLLVFASEFYDPDDYIRNYDEFITLHEVGK